MVIVKPISQIELQPGSHIRVRDVGWQEFEEILIERGEHSHTRLAYYQGILEVMSPLPEHERSVVIISDLIKLILRLQQRPWESLRSTTLKKQGIAAGIEPDECFYLENYQAVIVKDRIDLNVDPPPDLAIEIDVTSLTEINAYLALAVPEVWIYHQNSLTIYQLQNNQYIKSKFSHFFPELPILTIIPQAIKRSKLVGMSQALQEFEETLKTLIL
jgi:Uma2 family endonuclease